MIKLARVGLARVNHLKRSALAFSESATLLKDASQRGQLVVQNYRCAVRDFLSDLFHQLPDFSAHEAGICALWNGTLPPVDWAISTNRCRRTFCWVRFPIGRRSSGGRTDNSNASGFGRSPQNQGRCQ